MPTLEFGRFSKRNLTSRIVTGSLESNTLTPILNEHPMLTSEILGDRFRLRIMKGAYPTSWADLTSTTSRSADTLMEFSNVGNVISSISTLTPTSGPCIINTPLVAATQSGTASWFWAYTLWNGTDMGFRWLGTSITTIGGGGDLEIETLSIVSGTNYRISNFRIDFPATWTY